MKCPACGFPESKVLDSRPAENGSAIRRRRECLSCAKRFTTYERLDDAPLVVIKSDSSSEAYDREKLLRGLLIACAKRPISHDQIESVIDEIEQEIHGLPKNEIRSKDLGELALKKLALLDDVATIRFMSVYKDFQNIEEFEEALERISS